MSCTGKDCRVEAGINTRGIPSRICITCGGDTFKILVRLDEDNEIAWHTTNGYCVDCRAAITIPVPEYAVTTEVDFDDE